MNGIIKALYKFLPKKIIVLIGKSTFLKKIRNKILRPNNKAVIIREKVKWNNKTFEFFAPIKMAVKAKDKGIENKLIRTSLQLIDKLNKENPIVLDIGSNYGFISLALKTNLKKNAKIYAFEPHPRIYETFKQSIEYNNFDNIFVFNKAIGNETKDIELNLYGETSNILNINPSQNSKSIIISQTKMDDFLNENGIIPDFIKIDVDGYEIEVLRGLSETIKNYKPQLVVEYNDNKEVIVFLLEHDYTLLDMSLHPFNQVPPNIFCVN